jgi:hypothetical protein
MLKIGHKFKDEEIYESSSSSSSGDEKLSVISEKLEESEEVIKI